MHTRNPRRGLGLVLSLSLGLGLVLALAGCDAPDPATCVTTCSAADAPEAQAGCELVLVLDADCEGQADFAEVAVDGCLEPQDLHPGERRALCARPAAGATFTWTARSQDWQWGPWEDRCPGEGASLAYHLRCR